MQEKIFCVGIVGDGCGAGREFIVQGEMLVAYDPYTQKTVELLDGIVGAKSISKKECMLTIVCENEEIRFDLTALKKVSI